MASASSNRWAPTWRILLSAVALASTACADPDAGTEEPWQSSAVSAGTESASASDTDGSNGDTDGSATQTGEETTSAGPDETSGGPDSLTTGGTGDETGGTGDTGPIDPGPAGSCGMDGPTSGIVEVTLGDGSYYYLGVPPSDEPLPLVMAFHGDEGHPDQAVRWFWSPVWEAEQSFILVMVKCPGCTSWYMGDTNAKADYIWSVLDDVAGKADVDVSRMYAIGYSGGSSFLAMHGLEFQSVFAGIQWHCGGGWADYMEPPKPACKVDGRFVISTDDFLWDNAKAMEAILLEHGHEVEFIEAQCSGHCCHTDDLAEGAWAWFQQRTKCDDIVPGTCAAPTDIP